MNAPETNSAEDSPPPSLKADRAALEAAEEMLLRAELERAVWAREVDRLRARIEARAKGE